MEVDIGTDLMALAHADNAGGTSRPVSTTINEGPGSMAASAAVTVVTP